jgi:hypothetical protein
MNAFNALFQSLAYVYNQNMFWGSMGFTTAIGLFVGVMLFDGNIEKTKKGMVATLSYASMLLWTTFVRILPNALERNFVFTNAQPLAGIATIIFITIFWVLGVLIGVNIFKLKGFKE